MSSSSDELSWPKSWPDLEELDSLLRCGICYDYINTALMTPCSHNFCSICIRKYMLYKTNCPSCFADTVESQLKFNRTLDNIILIMKRLKAPLNQALKENIPSNKQNVITAEVTTPKLIVKTVHDINNTPISKGHTKSATVTQSPCRTTFITEQNSSFVENCVTPKNPERHVSVLSYAPPSPKTSSPMTSPSSEVTQKPRSVVQMLMSPVKKPGTLFTPSSPQTKVKPNTQASTSQQPTQASSSRPSPAATSVTKVPCPVCNVDIPERNINAHLDACLKNVNRAPEEKKSPSNFSGRRPLPKLVYHVLPERELKRKLADLKLSTQGDRKTLEKRHQRYTVLYNSECDKKEQRAVSELVKQVEREEKEESRSNCKTLTALQVDRKADPKVIEAAQKKYLKENKSSFASLIEQLKARRAADKAKKSNSTASSARPSSSKSDDSSDQPEIIDDDSSVSNIDLMSPKQSSKPSHSNPSPSVSSTSKLNDPSSPISSESSRSPAKIENSDPETHYSPDTSDNSQELVDTSSVKSPILGKKRLFGNSRRVQVVEISDEEDSAMTEFTPGDLDEIDALVQQSQVATNISPTKVPSEVIPNVDPAEIVQNDVPFEFFSGDDSDDAFQVPKKNSKTPVRNLEALPKRSRKREMSIETSSEPRRSTRKKPKH